MEKPKSGILDLAFDMLKTGADIVSGKMPKPENLANPRMKQIAKGIGDLAIFGWNSKRK